MENTYKTIKESETWLRSLVWDWRDAQGHRSIPRFSITDQRAWRLVVDGKDMPVRWIDDLSPGGMRVRIWNSFKFKTEGQLEIKLRYMGSDLVVATGQIMWKVPSSKSVNMYDIGLKFDKPILEISDRFERAQGLNTDLRFEKPSSNAHFIENIESEDIQAVNVKRPFMTFAELLMAVAVPFSIGYLFTSLL